MIFTMTDEAIKNYGEEWRGVKLEVTHKATQYMPAQKFYALGRPDGYHPGYDEGVSPTPLFDLKRVDTGEDLQFSLYRWELTPVKVVK
jgi:hypothetical protein